MPILIPRRHALAGKLILPLFVAAAVGCQPGVRDADRRPAATPLYRQTVAQIGDEIGRLHDRQPDFHQRIVALARRNIGQPYELYLLGEAPFETIDAQPVFNTQKSDCVVFVEHTLAMAMSTRFSDFLRDLQRIRYAGGVIGVRTRNHFTEADWNTNNAWLATDVTAEVGGPAVVHYNARTDREAFFRSRYHLAVPRPVQNLDVAYVPYGAFAAIKPKLRNGDLIEFVKGTSARDVWVHHMGIIAVGADGQVTVIHSTEPQVREEPLEAYIARATKNIITLDAQHKPRHRGFRFLRPVDDPVAALKAIDGEDAPHLTLPAESPLSFDTFVDDVLAGRR